MIISDFKQNRYLTYPHCNGFTPDGSLILGQLDGDDISLWKIDCRTGTERCLITFKRPDLGWIAFDIALEASTLAAVVGQELWIVDLGGQREARCAYSYDASALSGWDRVDKGLQALPSISRDSKRVVLNVTLPDKTQTMVVDVASGEAELLFEKSWFITHAHFCPYDENWIGFCHEGPAHEISDRVWGWHAGLAPDGVLLFDQRIGKDSSYICLGHERWSFHQAAAYVVAYGRGISPVGPGGLYKFTVDTPGKGELIRESDRYWHCNVSLNGRWAVVDTTGPHDAPGTGWDNAGQTSDILLIDLQDGSEHFLARSSRGPMQTQHPHPTFSPDNMTVFYNEVSTCGKYCRVRSARISQT